MKTREPMHKPLETKNRHGNPNLVGMVYEVESMHNSHVDHRIHNGDLLLCLEHTGDCHYAWALLSEAESNSSNQYYGKEKIYG